MAGGTIGVASGGVAGGAIMTGEGKTNEHFMPLTDDGTLSDYFSDIENQTSLTISSMQRQMVVEQIHSKPFSKLSHEKVKEARMEFNNKKNELIKQWEKNTGQSWPKYKKPVYNSRGHVVRQPGDYYDAHHIIECSFGGPADWWNITPAKFPTEHQQGIHRPGSPADRIFSN